MEDIVMKLLAFALVLLCVWVIAKIANFLMRRKIDPKVGKISFRESMDLVELPIVTFTNNGKKLNFLLDTGASFSSINESASEGLIFSKLAEMGTVMGMEGNKVDAGFIQMEVGYKEQTYKEDFQIVDLSQAFGILKSEYGINLSGILGNSFFQKYRYVIDFDELVVYSMV